MIRVLIVDDEKMSRQGIGYIIKMQKDMELIGEAANDREAVSIAQKKSRMLCLWMCRCLVARVLRLQEK